MKKIIVISLILSIFALFVPGLLSLTHPFKGDNQNAETTPPSSDSTTPEATPETQYVYNDNQVTVRVKSAGAVSNMTMSDYLTGVLSAEMPAAFSLEALKAQAVAARTETLYHMQNTPSANHPDADVCDDPSCCQAYINDKALREKWGKSYDTYINKIKSAVQDTDGECLIYNNAPIQAVFHSSSSAQTANSGEVWENSLPYLVSVKSPETADDVPNYISTVTVSLADFKQTVLRFYPDAVFPKNRSTWITDIAHSDSGRVSSLKLGGISVSGPVLRNMFGLRSTAASIKIDSKNVTFTTTGYGHGVGMSQYGANALAAQGKNYRDILTWYYTGVSFGKELSYYPVKGLAS